MAESENKFHQAGQFLEEKKYLHAIQIYQSLLDDPELRRKALIKLIEIYDRQNQIDAAVNAFEKYFSENGNDSNMRTFYAHFLIRKERYNEAHHVLSSVSKAENPEKNFLLGMVNYFLNDFEIAALNFREYINQDKKSPLITESYLYLSRCLINLRDLDEALKNIKAAEDLSNSNFEVYQAAAIIYYHKEMYFHAAEKIQKAIQLNAAEAGSFEWSAKIFFKLGEFQKAKRELEIYFDKVEPSSEVHAFMGLILKELKEYSAAIEHFDLALKLNPKNELAFQERANCKSLIN